MQDVRPQVVEGDLFDGKNENIAMEKDEWLVIAGNWIAKQLSPEDNTLDSPNSSRTLDFEEIPMEHALEIQKKYDELGRDATQEELSAFNRDIVDMLTLESLSPR